MDAVPVNGVPFRDTPDLRAKLSKGVEVANVANQQQKRTVFHTRISCLFSKAASVMRQKNNEVGELRQMDVPVEWEMAKKQHG